MADIIDDILMARKILKRVGLAPRPIALWFVDDQPTYDAFINSIKPIERPTLQKPFLTYPSGLRVYVWFTDVVREGDLAPDLPFLRPECKGLWAQMSDGKHRHYIYTDGQLLRLLKEEKLYWES